MNFEAELRKANIFRESLDFKMKGIVIPGDIKSRLFNGYYHLSLEHFFSVMYLLNHKFYASAAALLRPQYEAAVRGGYFQDYATDKAIEKFISGKSSPTLSTLVGDISTKLESAKESSFYRFFKKIEVSMNEFTHGGIYQINRRFTQSDLANNFSEKDKLVLASTSLVIAQLSAACTLSAAGEKQAALEILSDATPSQ